MWGVEAVCSFKKGIEEGLAEDIFEQKLQRGKREENLKQKEQQVQKSEGGGEPGCSRRGRKLCVAGSEQLGGEVEEGRLEM